jgi:hypothetical protein
MQPLLDRLHESLQQTPLSAIVLVGQIVQKEPSWLPKLPQHSLFASVLKQINASFIVVIKKMSRMTNFPEFGKHGRHGRRSATVVKSVAALSTQQGTDCCTAIDTDQSDRTVASMFAKGRERGRRNAHSYGTFEICNQAVFHAALRHLSVKCALVIAVGYYLFHELRQRLISTVKQIWVSKRKFDFVHVCDFDVTRLYYKLPYTDIIFSVYKSLT